jgi:hypothetical protein
MATPHQSHFQATLHRLHDLLSPTSPPARVKMVLCSRKNLSALINAAQVSVSQVCAAVMIGCGGTVFL